MFNFLIHNKGILPLIKTPPLKKFFGQKWDHIEKKKNQVFGSL